MSVAYEIKANLWSTVVPVIHKKIYKICLPLNNAKPNAKIKTEMNEKTLCTSWVVRVLLNTNNAVTLMRKKKKNIK